MKRLLCLLLLAVALVRCQQTPPPAATPAVNTVDTQLEGYWVNKAWWDTLQLTKSPRAAAKEAAVAAAVISQDSGKWVADMAYNWHEGSRYLLQADAGKYRLVYPENTTETAHQMAFLPDGTLRLDSCTFVRIGDSQTGGQRIAASLLSGTYTWSGKGASVVFRPDGTVTGLEGYNKYELLTDYIEDQLATDELILSTDGNQPDFYAFKFKDGHLLIFTIEETTDKAGDPEFKLGKVKYDLVK